MQNIYLIGFGIIFLLGLALILFIGKFYAIIYTPNPLLTPAELEFFKILKLAVNGKYEIFAQVRLASLVKPKFIFWKNLFPLIIRSVDFVLYDVNSGKNVLVIELDDSSHHLAKRKFRDNFVDRVLHQVGIPILHIPVQKTYQISRLKNLLLICS